MPSRSASRTALLIYCCVLLLCAVTGPVFVPATAMGDGGGGIPPPPDSTGEGDSMGAPGSPIVDDDPVPGVETVLRACLNAFSSFL